MNLKKTTKNHNQESDKWALKYSETALKELKKLHKKNPQFVNEIQAYMQEIQKLDDPCSRGKGLTANLAKLWRYRVRNYRIICKIDKGEILITVLYLDHRSEIYN